MTNNLSVFFFHDDLRFVCQALGFEIHSLFSPVEAWKVSPKKLNSFRSYGNEICWPWRYFNVSLFSILLFIVKYSPGSKFSNMIYPWDTLTFGIELWLLWPLLQN